ncbi:MAG: type II secretion system F family protein [Candidatus Peribacteria bacterium]|nr:type II secretion system F family protein [Candidatus Peribacteria bacterium]
MVGTVVGYQLLYMQVLVFKMFIDALLLKVPLVKNVIRLFYMSRFTSLLGQFYEAGVSPVISFGLLASIFDNFSYKRKMIEIKNSISAGFSIYESMEGSELFDPILIQIINVGENTGSLTEVLKKISIYYTSSLKNAIDALMAIIEPLLMAFVACIVGVLLGAIYLPMADMVNQIK